MVAFTNFDDYTATSSQPSAAVIHAPQRMVGIGTTVDRRSWRSLWRLRAEPVTVMIPVPDDIGSDWLDLSARVKFDDGSLVIDFMQLAHVRPSSVPIAGPPQ